ncbi:hypothetical protein BZG02_09890 [Labilibaculum filiforme]|uniref:Uncharacterized protein n=1 Tax=Labilibaculum filiforme TaxID=1940526 RepID=A0A2N3HYC3_9BACT|nr:hypothetical protein BZG02_09885 [Labilibaculum filiforme]PKQ63070.1 hypothetical protein BZG02_09890 [Labilibaculum filiforme]
MIEKSTHPQGGTRDAPLPRAINVGALQALLFSFLFVLGIWNLLLDTWYLNFCALPTQITIVFQPDCFPASV